MGMISVVHGSFWSETVSLGPYSQQEDRGPSWPPGCQLYIKVDATPLPHGSVGAPGQVCCGCSPLASLGHAP